MIEVLFDESNSVQIVTSFKNLNNMTIISWRDFEMEKIISLNQIYTHSYVHPQPALRISSKKSLTMPNSTKLNLFFFMRNKFNWKRKGVQTNIQFFTKDK